VCVECVRVKNKITSDAKRAAKRQSNVVELPRPMLRATQMRTKQILGRPEVPSKDFVKSLGQQERWSNR
jgi:hypothetical protein